MRWRRRYGAEMARLLDDLRPMPPSRRLATSLDLLRGALDAHLSARSIVDPTIRAALRRAVAVAAVVWAALSVEIVLSNVVFPSAGDDDAFAVVGSYLTVFAALAATGFLVGRTASSWRVLALAGAVAGGLIGVLTIGTYFAVDNAFLGTIGQQQSKIDGLAGSGMSSMRAYVNLSLLPALGGLSTFLAIAGAFLANAGGRLAAARQAIRPVTGTRRRG